MSFLCPASHSQLVLRTAVRSVCSAAALPRRLPGTTLASQPFSCAAWKGGRSISPQSRGTLDSAPQLRSRGYDLRIHPRPGGQLQQQRRTFFSPAIIRSYEDLPRDYKDKIGLQFRKGDLSEAEVERLFGSGLKAASANRLLRILHGRRVAGTLDDPAFTVHTRQYSEDQIAKGLEYLRKTVVVDEVLNAGLRAEDELNELEAEQDAKEEAEEEQRIEVQKKKKSKDKEAVDAEAAGAVPPEEDPVYGKSVFDQIRARNIAKNKVREKALKEEEEKRKELAEAAAQNAPKSLVEVEEGQRAITNPKIAAYYMAATSDMKEAPEMPLWQRVAPSAVLVTLVLGFCASVCMVYQEPSDRYRLLSDVSIETATLSTIIGANVLVFLAWRAPPLWRFLNRYMILVVGLPRPASVFASMFSHKQLGHMVVNLVPMYLVGTYLHEDLGRAAFVTLYLACGSIGFLGSLLTYAARGMTHVTTLGASGATLGLLSAWFWDHRDEGFRIMGLPDGGVHGIVYWALLVALHLAGAGSMFSNKDKIDLVSHLFGIIAGTVGIEVMNWCGLGRQKKGKDAAAVAAAGDEKVKDLVTGKEVVLASK